jgi:hypothetical protein
MIYTGAPDVLLTKCTSWFDEEGQEVEMKASDR